MNPSKHAKIDTRDEIYNTEKCKNEAQYKPIVPMAAWSLSP